MSAPTITHTACLPPPLSDSRDPHNQQDLSQNRKLHAPPQHQTDVSCGVSKITLQRRHKAAASHSAARPVVWPMAVVRVTANDPCQATVVYHIHSAPKTMRYFRPPSQSRHQQGSTGSCRTTARPPCGDTRATARPRWRTKSVGVMNVGKHFRACSEAVGKLATCRETPGACGMQRNRHAEKRDMQRNAGSRRHAARHRQHSNMKSVVPRDCSSFVCTY